jgi:hypothetical protein
LAGLKDSSGSFQQELVMNRDKLFFEGLTAINKTIIGFRPSLVSKVDPDYIKSEIEKGNKPPVPCYLESVATVGSAIGNTVIIVGAGAAGALAGGAIAGAGAAAINAGSSSLVALYLGANTGVATGAGAAAGAVAGVTWLPLKGTEYIKCDSPVRSNDLNGAGIGQEKVYKVGDELYNDVIEVTQNNFKNLGMYAPVSSSDPKAYHEIYVIPGMYFHLLGRPNDFISAQNFGKSLYVQHYKTEQEAIDNEKQPPPATVPGAGNIEGNFNDTTSGIGKLINDVLTAIAQTAVNGIFWAFTTIIAPLLTGVLSVRVYTDAFVNVIYPGWEVLRNVVNIYFIVAIIAIALATLFRVESYKFRPLLIKLIIAALIVNFSLVICQVILAVADTLQSQFLPNNQEVIGALARDLMPAKISDIIRTNQLVSNSVFATAITTLFFMSMALGGFLVFTAILGYLFVRIVMVWIFLILSPLAFAADVLPSTSGMGQKWWGEFIKYAFFTPVMAFFLNMAAVIAVNYESIFGSISTNLVYGSSDYSKFTVLILATASNVLLWVFLFGAVNIAQSFGVFGANAVDGVFKTGVFAPFVGGGGVVALGGKGLQWLGKDVAGGWIQKQYNNRTAKLAEGNSKFKKALYAGLHIPSTVKAFRKDASEELQRSKDLTSAAALSIKRQTPGFKRKGEDPLALYNEHKGKELLEERRGETTDTEEDEVIFGLQLYEEAISGGSAGRDAQLMLTEQIRRMAKNHNLNEFLERFGVKYFGADPKKRNFKYTRENIIGMLQEMQDKGAMTAHVNTDLQKRLGKYGYEFKDYTLSELTYNHHGHAKAIDVEFDRETKSFVVKGKSIYDRIRKLAQDNSTTQEEYDAIVSREVQNLSHSDHELYENASKYEEKIMEALINLKKRDDIDQVKQWWESVVSKKVMPDGSVKPVLAMSGLHLIRNFGAGHEFYASRGNISTKILELLLPLIKDKEHFRSEVEKAIITDAQVTGRKVYDLELEKDKLEYQALRVAAVAEKDTSLVGLEAYDIAIPDPQDPKKKIAIKPSDPRYKDILRQQTQALRGILKEDLKTAINAEDDED